MNAAPDPLAPLRERFLQRCREDLAVLEAEAAEPDVLRLTVHRLSGAAGTFGYAEASRLAGELDERLHQGLAPAPGQVSALVAVLRAMLEP